MFRLDKFVFGGFNFPRFLRFFESKGYMMIFGVIFVCAKCVFGGGLKENAITRSRQYIDTLVIGFGISIITFFISAAFDIVGDNPINWLFIPGIISILLYYIIFYVEWGYHKYSKSLSWEDAYDWIGYIRQADFIERTWNLPCAQQNQYVTLGWWLNKHRI